MKLTDLEDDKIKMETKSKQELDEIKQNLWRRYRDKGNQKLEPTRSGKIPEGWKLKDKIIQKPTITDYFDKKREENKARARQLQDHWDLMKVCVDYIEENEDWLIANRMERSYQDEERQRAWEREEKLAGVKSKKSEMLRKKIDKTEIKPDEKRVGECFQKAGNSKKDGGDEMTNLAWKYWHQKSAMIPGEPVPSLPSLPPVRTALPLPQGGTVPVCLPGGPVPPWVPGGPVPLLLPGQPVSAWVPGGPVPAQLPLPDCSDQLSSVSTSPTGKYEAGIFTSATGKSETGVFTSAAGKFETLKSLPGYRQALIEKDAQTATDVENIQEGRKTYN